MYADIEIIPPTNKNELIKICKEIRDYYIYHKDEFKLPPFVPLLLPKLEFSMPTDSEITSFAISLLKASQMTEKFNRRQYLRELKIKKQEELNSLSEKKTSARLKIEEIYSKKYEEYFSIAKLRGVAYSEKTVETLSSINSEKENLIYQSDDNYDTLISGVRLEIANIEDDLTYIDAYFLEKHQAEIETKKKELFDNYVLYQNEIIKYNNQVEEKVVRQENALIQSEFKIMVEYMKVIMIDPSKTDLMRRGYYSDLVEQILPYYLSFDNKIEAYNEFLNENEFSVILEDFYEGILTALRVEAYGISNT